MAFDLLERRKEKFVLWTPDGQSAPQLVLGVFEGQPSPTIREIVQAPLVKSDQKDLWEVSPGDIRPKLEEGVYHYWFEVSDTSKGSSGQIRVTDPLAFTVDYRTIPTRKDTVQPPAVIKYRDERLWPCDVDGKEAKVVEAPVQPQAPANNRMVIYELPTSWSKPGIGTDDENGPDKGKYVVVDRGTFDDVRALFDKQAAGTRFSDIAAVKDEAILTELGINALELLPIADSKFQDEWGYATAHYFAPDFDLGSASELVQLVKTLRPGIRLILDTVTAFGRGDPYTYITFQQFHLDPKEESKSPDARQSHSKELRDGYGGASWRYIKDTETYDPRTGQQGIVHPAWSFHQAHLHRWLLDFGATGLRLDSINNVGSYDFIKAYKDHAWALHQARHGASDKFIVIGEELSVPKDLLTTGTLNALWNEPFKGRLRSVIIGEERHDNDNFEWTVRKMVDCTLDGFQDGAQAVNYITSHDVEGPRNERLFNFLQNNHVYDIERRAKLAFVCLLTAVGIPMIFAGEEFCDQMDNVMSRKQVDPVNYARKAEDWRSRVFNYVARLVDLRKNCPALSENDTSFFHVDASRGGKIIAWKRGTINPVVVLANFTDNDTPGSQYYVPDWPDRDRDGWHEITQNRAVPKEWVGKEPLMHWEAKVYTCWK